MITFLSQLTLEGIFQINIQQVAIPETPLPTYSIVIIKDGKSFFELVISFSISIGYGKYEVRNFKSTEGLKSIREVTKAIKT